MVQQIFLKLFSYVKKFSPDIIITDREPFLMAIAKTLNIKLFDISPINIYFAIEWGNNEYKYKNVLNSFIRDQYYLPKADEYFIYSPYYRFNIKLKKDFKWIKPYVEKMEGEEEYISLTYRDISKILKYCSIKETLSKAKTAYCTGETSLMSDLILNDIDNIHIMPDLSDPETLINAMVNRKVGLGQDLGQVELMQHMAVEEIESVKKKYWQTSFNKIEPLNLAETIKRYS